MSRFILLLLGLAVVAGISYYYVTGGNPLRAGDQTPQRALENVRGAAQRIEADDAKRAQELLEKTQSP